MFLNLYTGNGLTLAQQVAALFAAGEQGIWLDPSDLTTMFQDAAGTTPVTAVEQPVGLLLDKSKGLVLGSELVTNGTFDSSTANWTAGTNITLSVDSQRLKVVYGGSASQGASQTVTGLTVGKTYILKVTFIQGNVPTNFFYIEGFAGLAGQGGFNTSGDYTFYFTANTTTSSLTIRTAGTWQVNDYFFLDNISVKELAGNHATQATSTSRPTLSARYNLLTYTEDFSNAWLKYTIDVTANQAADPFGGNAADLLLPTTASSNTHYVAQNAITSAAVTMSCYVKAAGYSKVGIGDSAYGQWASFNLTTEQVIKTHASSTATITSAGNGWYLCTLTIANTPSSTKIVSIKPLDDAYTDTYIFSYTYTGDGVSGVYAFAANALPTNQSTIPYQRVTTATDYNTDATKFPKYLKFDGVDDSLATASINFTATDKMTVWAGVRKLNDSATQIIAELSSSSSVTNGTLALFAPLNGGIAQYVFRSRGTSASEAIATPFAAPITNVVTGISDISGDISSIRINGSVIATTVTDQGTGNYGNYPLYIGSRASTSLIFNGQIYSLIIRGAESTATQITNTETYVAGKTGVTL